MIFYNFFTERWLAATDSLTAMQEGIYLRLVNWMYRNEMPLPLDMEECARIARVRGKPELETLPDVIGRYFSQTSAGWVQAKTLHEISRFQQAEPVRQMRRMVDKERKAASRGEQHRLYALAREKGLTVRPRMRLNELRELVGEPIVRMVPKPESVQASEDVSQPDAAADASEFRQPHVPLPTTHIEHPADALLRPADADADAAPDARRLAARLDGGPLESVPKAPEISDERLRTAVQALRDGGLIGINSGHPMLLELLRAGIRDEALTLAAATAAAKGKGFAYALAIAEGQMRDAAAANVPNARARAAANIVAQIAPGLEAKW